MVSAALLLIGQTPKGLSGYEVHQPKNRGMVVRDSKGNESFVVGYRPPPIVHGHSIESDNDELRLRLGNDVVQRWLKADLNKMLHATPEAKRLEEGILITAYNPWVFNLGSAVASRGGWTAILGFENPNVGGIYDRMRCLVSLDVQSRSLRILRVLESNGHYGRENLQEVGGRIYFMDGYLTSKLEQINEEGKPLRTLWQKTMGRFEATSINRQLGDRWLVIRRNGYEVKGELHIYDTLQRRTWKVNTGSGKGAFSYPHVAAYDPKTTTICVACGDESPLPMHLVNLRTRSVFKVKLPYRTEVFALVNKMLFARSQDGYRNVKVFRVSDGKLLGTLPIHHEN